MVNRFKHIPFPWYTTLFSVVLIVYFTVLILLSTNKTVDVDDMLNLGAPSALTIYKGHVYGVFTNTLIHENVWHLLVNLGGLWTFGFYLENYKGWKFLSVFGLMSAIVGSLIQLTLSDDAGIGISSSLFALFSYATLHTIFVRKQDVKFAIPVASVVLASLLFFALTNYFLEDRVSIWAKIAGLCWGIFFFYCERLPNPLHYISPFLVVVLLSITLVYTPWSSMWQTYKGVEAHKEQDIDAAEVFYQKAITIDNSNIVALENHRRIKVYRLSLLAHEAHEDGRFSEARRYYLKILALGKNNRWVLENLKELP